jgi:site-specific DNA-methyltransferase (adenine-specific)
MLNQIIQGDCYELMKEIPDGNIDAIISDFPYNTTPAETDKNPFNPLKFWPEAMRILAPAGSIITTASQPFTTDLINSNRNWFRFEMIWDKALPTGFLDSKRRPLKRHENIIVFAPGRMTYNPIMRKGIMKTKGGSYKSAIYGHYEFQKNRNDEYYPTTILEFSNGNRNTGDECHPTQKPLPLYEYLIKTFTNPGATILDPYVGSGTTAIAAFNTGRNFIAFEELTKYYLIANKRLALAQMQGRFEEMVS